MSFSRQQRGFTLLETVVVLAISGLVLTSLAAITASLIRNPVKIQSEAAASRQIQDATLIITDDANAARTFTAGTSTEYGTFSWFDFNDTTPRPVSARYYWADNQLLRVFSFNNEASPPQIVIEPVLQASDITFTYTAPSWVFSAITKQWTYTEGSISVVFTSTRDAGAQFPDTVVTATVQGDFRPQADRPVPLPGRLPPPVPPANQVGFRAASLTLITGTLQGGTVADLRFDDTSYYEVKGAGGGTKVIEWEATSEVINYTTITDISIEFTGQVDNSGVSQSFFVYNPTAHGTSTPYDVAPDNTTVYSIKDVDSTVLFAFNEADVSYVNGLGSKVVRIKLNATFSGNFKLLADRLVFKVAGTPAPAFSRDYFADTDPSITIGEANGGTFASLIADDDNYWDVKHTGGTAQYEVVSEAITLDAATSTEVRFTGKLTSGSVTLKFYIFNPANGGSGYATTTTATTTISTTEISPVFSFFLNASDLAYVNSLFPKEVRMRVQVDGLSGGGTRFLSEYLTFRVKP